MKKEYIIYKLSEEMKNATRIENELFKKFDVKRGLRNEDGTGVLVGLTKIGNVVNLLEYALHHNIHIELLSDQTSCHAVYEGGYCPAGISFVYPSNRSR